MVVANFLSFRRTLVCRNDRKSPCIEYEVFCLTISNLKFLRVCQFTLTHFYKTIILPNTLCHIGIQGPLSRLVDKKYDIRWIIAGSIIPDLPWIWLKILLLFTTLNPYDLRLYFTAQASLLFCLTLSAALALWSKNSRFIFITLALNCLFHLLLDAVQIKWGNGVHLFAPLTWTMSHFDRTWPEHFLTTLFTFAGLVFLLRNWKSSLQQRPSTLPDKSKLFSAVSFILIYLLAPAFYLTDLERADVYYINTLRQKESRPGKLIEFDRVHYFANDQNFVTFTGEFISLQGKFPKQSGRVSFKGHFISPSKIDVKEFHYHTDHRDIASAVGIFMACTLLFQSLILSRFRNQNTTKGN